MARSLANQQNVESPDSDFPFSRIKNDDGTGNGTHLTEEVHGDFFQFFEKLMDAAGIVHNELPDQAYTGFQLFEALKKLCVTSERTSPALITKVVEIGDWNMDSASQKNVEHGIADYKKIRSISGIIRNDLDTMAHQIGCADITGALDVWFVTDGTGSTIDSTYIRLYRAGAGHFDHTNYDSTSYNRGWITIVYEA